MLKLFQQQLGLICPDWRERRFLVAFSGGLDSTALLHLMALSLPAPQIAAAHLNHLIRPEAADDQSFAAQTCLDEGLEFVSESIDVPALAKERRRGLEEAARHARYDFLLRASRLWQADLVVTAHQADDQAETILMHLIKGGGAGGLAGIHLRRPLSREHIPGPELLRPLLPFSRLQLRKWLETENYAWIEDASNNDGRYLRNAIRTDILPKLVNLNPRLLEALGRTASILRDEEYFWKKRLTALWPSLIDEKTEKNLIYIDRHQLKLLTVAEKRRIIYEAFLKIWHTRPGTPEPLSMAGVETVLDMLSKKSHNGLDLPGGLRAALTIDSVVLSLASRFRNQIY